MKFKRRQSIQAELSPKRALIIYGPRRVGKTTMLNSYLDEAAADEPSLRRYYATGDDMALRELFQSERQTPILDFARPFDVIAVDEAQNVPKIGLGAKMIVDAFPEKRLILTGSSSFDLSREVGEPLTGRHFTMTLLPLAQMEMQASRFELKQALPDFLVYGSYPEILLEEDKVKKQKILNELVSSYLFKDVLALDRIKSSKVLLDIVRCLAFQVGSEVSLNEIGRTVGADAKTVGRYIDLLEKMFILVRVGGFRRNLRNEIAKKAKYYFLDNGVRNAVIAQFNGLETRNDVGALWENFVVTEMMKRGAILGSSERYYFWRTHEGREIDFVRETGSGLAATECKWSPQEVAPPSEWAAAYPDASFSVVHRDNYLDILLG
jgi:hypothetical protein